MTTFNNGDEVKITINGKVASNGAQTAHSHCHTVKDTSGFTHHVFLEAADYAGSGEGCSVELVKAAEKFTVGKAYEDGDGDVFLRAASGNWVDHHGTVRRDAYPSRPMVALEAAPTLTETKLAELVSGQLRGHGYSSFASRHSVSIARELVRGGVKVASK